MVRPRYFPLSTASRVWPWSLYTVCFSCRLLVLMWMTWHFFWVNCIYHFLSHSSKARRSCWTDSPSTSQLMGLYSRQSSAKRRGSESLSDSGRSFINVRNNSGPRTVSRCTPEMTSACWGLLPSSNTCCFLCPRNHCLRISPRIP